MVVSLTPRAVLGIAAALALFPTTAFAQDPIRVGSKLDGEGGLLGSMIIQVLEANGITTENRLQMGVTA